MANNPTWPLRWVHEETPLSEENLNLMVDHIRDTETKLNNAITSSLSRDNSMLSSINKINNSELPDIKKNINNNIREISNIKSVELPDIDSQISSINSQISSINQQISSLGSTNTSQSGKITTLDNKVSDHTDDIKALESTVSDHTDDISSIEAKVDQNTANIEGINSTITNNINPSMAAMSVSIEGHTTKIDNLITSVESNTMAINNIDNIVTGNNSNSKLRNDISELQALTLDASKGNEALYTSVENNRNNIGYLIGRDTDVQGYMDELGEYASKITDLTDRVEALEDGNQSSSGDVTPSAGVKVYTNTWFKTTAANGEYDTNLDAASVKFVQSAVSKHGIDDGSID